MEIIAEFLEDHFQIFDVNKSKEKILLVGQVQSGKTKFMIDQSFEALEGGYDTVIILGGTNNNLLFQTKKRFNSSVFENEYTLFDSSDKRYTRIPEHKSIIVCLKGADALRKLLKIIHNTPFKKKVLVFDDESDFGGIDISRNENPSTISGLLDDLFNSFKQITFVSVTATPFADILSTGQKAFNRSHAIIPNKEYTGSKFFLENKQIYIQDERLSELIRIKEILIDHIKRVSDYEKHLKSIPENEKIETQMLINNSLDTSEHIYMAQRIDFILSDMIAKPKKYNFDYEHKLIAEQLKENLFILNKENNFIDFSNTHSIIIGGVLVSRGYTFDCLLTTLISNSPVSKDSADTLLQRARWFGYRRKNDMYKYMKVYLPNKTYDSIIECDELINEVYKMIENKASIDELRKYVSGIELKYIKPTGKGIKKWKEN